MALVLSQTLWSQQYVVSDDDDEDMKSDTPTENIGCAQKLPILSVQNASVLSEQQRAKLQFVLDETNRHITLMKNLAEYDTNFSPS